MKTEKVASTKLVCGVGINDADYVVQKWKTLGYVDGKRKQRLVWCCPYFRTWNSMIKRCYSDKYQERYPTYKGCSVSEEWKTFSNFRAWMVTQDWEGKHLDKDLLFEGNKVYSAETCVFVSSRVNLFTTDRGNDRGEWLIGVSWHKRDGKFQSQCSNPFTKKREHLGYFTNEQEAHQEWLKRKLELAYELAETQTDPRVAKALINRYTEYRKSSSSDINSKKVSNVCNVCGGYGYIEAISMSWTESDFEEFSCKQCNQEQEDSNELES